MEEILALLTQNHLIQIPLYEQIIVLLGAIICGLIIGWVYMYAHKTPSYSKSFTISLVIITPLVAVIMLVIGASIIRAFTLLGALALIRFRNAVKEPWDTAVIFWAVVVGMTMGSKIYGFAVIILVVIGALLIILSKTRFGEKKAVIILQVNASEQQIRYVQKQLSAEIVSCEPDHNSESENKYTLSLTKNNRLMGVLENAKISKYSLYENTSY